MNDRRQEILNKFIFKMDEREVVREEDALDAMDEYMRITCLELLEYMAKNKVICGHYSSVDGLLFKVNGHELLTAEQLFENFL